MENMLVNTLGTWGTYLKLDENPFGAQKEPGRNEKKSSPPPPKLKRKKHIECMFGPSHWLHEISFPKNICHHFGLI
jgi:hypothetical protein